MDIEGAEYEVLKDDKWLNDERIQYMAIEVHGDTRPIVRVLRSKGFHIRKRFIRYTPSSANSWLKIRPLWYGILMYLYKYIVANIIEKPQIKIIYAYRKT